MGPPVSPVLLVCALVYGPAGAMAGIYRSDSLRCPSALSETGDRVLLFAAVYIRLVGPQALGDPPVSTASSLWECWANGYRQSLVWPLCWL
jgi:hypothetical protein